MKIRILESTKFYLGDKFITVPKGTVFIVSTETAVAVKLNQEDKMIYQAELLYMDYEIISE